MSHAVVRIFDVFEYAQRARLALLTDGFAASGVMLSVVSDEAGPAAGNFIVGNSPLDSPRHTYERNYANAGPDVHCLMTVDAPDQARAERAAGILSHFGARDIDALMPLGR